MSQTPSSDGEQDGRASLRSAVERWRHQVLARSRARTAERRPVFETSAGIPLPELLTPLDRRPEEEELEALGLPGEPPYTRGVQPNMYRGRLWTMRQYAGFGTAEESNRRYRYLLAQGNTGLSVAFDLPTQMGLDSDDPRAAGEVGRTGVAIDTLRDVELLFDQIPLDQVSTSMTINATAPILLCLYVAVAEGRGIDRRKLRGTIQNDILKEYIARGTYIYPPRPSMRLVTDVFAFCQNALPHWNTISISGYHIREAGSDAVQEVAFTLADGLAYVQAALDAGLRVDDFAPQLAFFFNAHNNLLEEVAKFRAARRLWARLMRERFGAQDPRSLALRFHTQTAGSTLTAQQPYGNVVRVALQALSAVLGGTQSLHTNAFDEALALPTEESVRLALRTQQIIAHESGVADLVDPLGGSYAVEYLTDQIESRAQDYLARIDELGGMVGAIEAGYPQREIQRRAYEHQLSVERRERVVVGVNDFLDAEEEPLRLHRVDPASEAAQKRRTAEVRAGRAASRASEALNDLARAARTGDPLVEKILHCVNGLCTIGEISGCLEQVFGRYDEAVAL
ncbi:MAG: methylmalonyl-CoA mutase [Deltaproteobacteria bacterium]|nr:methylmalonyl-CoA mutase [Deltaproteobacteria bacterium]